MLATQKKFAEISGVSKQAIGKLVKKGGLVIRPDGKIDTKDPVNSCYLKKQDDKLIAKERALIKQVQNAELKEALNDALPEINFDELPKDSDLMNYQRSDLECLKIIEHIKGQRLKHDIARGELISRKLIKSVFSKFYEIDMNEFLTIKDKLLPDIAAIFGVNDTTVAMKAGERMDEELWKVLKHIQQVKDRFLKSINAEN